LKAAARCSDKTQSLWTLTSVAVRIAHAIGIHRDGNCSFMSLLEVEQRRRTWWQVCQLDARASEDRGSDPVILEHTFNTVKPLNVNDIDLTRGDVVEERTGITEMSLSLLSHETFAVARVLDYLPPNISTSTDEFDVRERERMVYQCYQKIQARFLDHCDLSIPYHRLVFQVGRLIMSRLWLSIRYPSQTHTYSGLRGLPGLPERLADGPPKTALAVLQLCEDLEVDYELSSWTWLSLTYVPWHALAVALADICDRPAAGRTWLIIQNAIYRWIDRLADTKPGASSNHMNNLVHMAQRVLSKSK
jgi:hypothetical protein